MLTSWSCAAASSRAWSGASPDTPEGCLALLLCLSGATALNISAQKHTQGNYWHLYWDISFSNNIFPRISSSRGLGGQDEYLWWCSEVDDAVQLDVFAKLVVQPAVPVLVDWPFRVSQTLALVEVGCKDVPETQDEVVRQEICTRSVIPYFQYKLHICITAVICQNILLNLQFMNGSTAGLQPPTIKLLLVFLITS